MSHRLAPADCRWALIVLLLIASTGGAFAADPVLHLSFDGEGVDVASGVPVTWTYGERFVAGARGGAAYFNGLEEGQGGSRLRIARDSALFSMQRVTIAGWYRRADLQADGLILWNHGRYGFGVDGRELVFYISTTGGSIWERPAVAPEDTSWHHVAMVYDGACLRGYLDGRLVAERLATGVIGAAASWDPMVGSSPWGSAFRGGLDDIRVYRDALDATEIASLAEPDSTVRAALVSSRSVALPDLHFPLDGDPASADGTVAASTTGTVNWVDGRMGKSADVSSGRIRLSRDPAFFDTDQLTLALWAKKNSTAAAGAPFWNHVRYGIEVGGSGLTYTLYLPDGPVAAFVPAAVADTEWHHLALVYDGAVLRGYLDGRLVVLRTGLAGRVGPASYWDPQIGARSSVSFQGAVDDVRIYRAALGSDGIAGLGAVAPANQPPTVDAGDAQQIAFGEPARLSATVVDDADPHWLSVRWRQVHGPGTVTFDDASHAATSASFSLSGTYTLEATVDDGQYSASDTVQVTMSPPGYVVPTMTAGADATAALPLERLTGGYPADQAEQAIAKINMVPFQSLSTPTPVGVQAFHIDGIDRVRFRLNGGVWVDATRPTWNDRTGMVEFVALLDPSGLPDGPVVVQAEAVPLAGLTRSLEIPLFVNAGGTLTARSVYVDPIAGDDTATGEQSRPLRSLTRALEVVPGGGEIILASAGTYWVERRPSRSGSLDNGRWITIRPAHALRREEVVIAGPTAQLLRPYVDRLKWQGVTFDFARIRQVYPESGQHVWFDSVLWTDSLGWTHKHDNHLKNVRALVYIGGSYVTRSAARDMLYAYADMSLVRDCSAERISGDVFQNSRMVLNCLVDTVEGDVLDHHSDLLQYFGHHENVIVNGLKMANIKETQNFFLDHYKSSFEDMAFVNIAIQNLESTNVATQFNSSNRHVLFLNVSHPNQRVLFRTRRSSGAFAGRAMLFQNCVTTYVWTDCGTPLPAGVHYVGTHFTDSEGFGDCSTSGDVWLQNGPGMNFAHAGAASELLVGSGYPMHNVVHPNDGRGSLGLPSRGAYPVILNPPSLPAPVEEAVAAPMHGPVLHLKFDGDLVDSASGIAARWTGSAVYADGVAGRSARLNGSSDVRTARDPRLFGQSALTLAMWVRKSTPDEIGYPFWNHRRYGLKVEGDSVTCFLYTDAGIVLYQKAVVPDLRDTDWHHVAFTYDGSTLTGYVDGKVVTLKTGLAGRVEAPSYWDPIVGSKLGQDPFAGDVDDVRVYSRALTADEVGVLATP